MAKLYFRFGAMGSGKTANALMLKYNFEERGLKVLYCKPSIDTRDGDGLVRSRCGLESDCHMFENLQFMNWKNYDIIIVDEVHFLSESDIMFLEHIVDNYDINVFCYGLKADFQGNLFDGSYRLITHADKLEELKTTCWCGRKAMHNARIFNGQVIKKGSQVQIGGNDSYIALCRKHFKDGELS